VPRRQPAVEVRGLGGPYVASMRYDFAAALSIKIEAATASALALIVEGKRMAFELGFIFVY
jgi:hypothetical protein